MSMVDVQAHWERLYAERAPDQVSWHERVPEHSLALIEQTGLGTDAAILDVGAGASTLAAQLIARGYRDVTVADISPAALARARSDAGTHGEAIAWIEGDVRCFDPGRGFDLWHDRAVFHFMVERADRDRYLAGLLRALRPAGHVIVATFGPAGPTRCSGLPVRRYGPSELARTLGGEFELVSSELVEHHTPAGRSQQFLYAHLRRWGGA